MVTLADGRKEIREIINSGQLRKRAVVEQLELSRRYWSALDVSDWKVVVDGMKGQEVVRFVSCAGQRYRVLHASLAGRMADLL